MIVKREEELRSQFKDLLYDLALDQDKLKR